MSTEDEEAEKKVPPLLLADLCTAVRAAAPDDPDVIDIFAHVSFILQVDGPLRGRHMNVPSARVVCNAVYRTTQILVDAQLVAEAQMTDRVIGKVTRAKLGASADAA